MSARSWASAALDSAKLASRNRLQGPPWASESTLSWSMGEMIPACLHQGDQPTLQQDGEAGRGLDLEGRAPVPAFCNVTPWNFPPPPTQLFPASFSVWAETCFSFPENLSWRGPLSLNYSSLPTLHHLSTFCIMYLQGHFQSLVMIVMFFSWLWFWFMGIKYVKMHQIVNFQHMPSLLHLNYTSAKL